MSENDRKINYMTIIAGRKSKDSLLSLLAKEGGQLIDVSYGKGAFKANYIQGMLGLVHEEVKVVISCLLSETKTDAMLNKLIEENNFDKANTGIAFTVPVEKLSF